MCFTFENIHHGCMRTCLDALQALTSLSAEPRQWHRLPICFLTSDLTNSETVAATL